MGKWQDLLPAAVLGRALSLGDVGTQWLHNLDPYVSDLEEKWDIRVSSVLNGGSHAFIGTASGPSGIEYILKIELPDCPEAEFLQGVQMLEQAQGVGYSSLFAVDCEKRAMLLERLGDPLGKSSLIPQAQMTLLCEAMMQTWNLPIRPEDKTRNDNNYPWFQTYIPRTWEELGKPCALKVVQTAMEHLNWLMSRTDPGQYVWVHGDAHNGNMLRVPGTDRYKFIDPDGKIFEKSYDVGVLMREWPEEYETEPYKNGRLRSQFLSGLTGVPPEDIWAWGFLQMVATALILLQIGQQSLGTKMLSIAQAWT